MANWLAHLGRLAEATLHSLERASIAVSRVLNLAGGLHAISHSYPSGQHPGYKEGKDDRRGGGRFFIQDPTSIPPIRR